MDMDSKRDGNGIYGKLIWQEIGQTGCSSHYGGLGLRHRREHLLFYGGLWTAMSELSRSWKVSWNPIVLVRKSISVGVSYCR